MILWAKHILGPSTEYQNSPQTQTIHVHANKLIILLITIIACKQYAVFTYRSILVTSCRRHKYNMCNSGALIRIGTEKPQNKGIFVFRLFPCCTFISLIVSIFKTNLAVYYINPPFSIDFCSNLIQD